MKNYIDADEEVVDLFDELTERHNLHELRHFKFKFLFNMKERKSKGKITLGSAEKCSEKNKALHGYDFVIILDYPFWQANPDKREPLLFHEMLHCGENESGDACIIPHDLEEFGAVVREYGMWKNDVRKFSDQLNLFNEPAKV